MHLWPSVGSRSLLAADLLGWTFTDKKSPPAAHTAGLCQRCSNRGLVALGPYEPSRLDFCDKKKRSPSPPACPTRGAAAGETSDKSMALRAPCPLSHLSWTCATKKESLALPRQGGPSDKCQPSEGSSCPAPSQPF